MDKNTKQLNQQLVQSNAHQHNGNNEPVDLVQILLNLKKQWKVVVGFTMLGALLSLALAVSKPKVYRESVKVSLPNELAVTHINVNGIEVVTKNILFNDFYNQIRSESWFESFVESNNYIGRLYPDVDPQTGYQQQFADLINNFKVDIIEPIAAKNTSVENPSKIKISLQHTNETLLVDFLNNYVESSNDYVLSVYADLQEKQRSQKIREIDSKIELLRKDALNSRKLLIAKIEDENTLKIEQLEQEKELLIGKAKSDRNVKIAQAEEALLIAKKLGIENPTRLDDLDGLADKSNEGVTNINLLSNQELPLYLMGTKYLEIFIETLRKRTDDGKFLDQINKINSDISKVKADKTLASLKMRVSDDPYIDELPKLMNMKNALNSKSIQFDGVNLYTLNKAASVTNKAIKPNKPLIVILGTILAGMIGLFYALFASAVASRNMES